MRYVVGCNFPCAASARGDSLDRRGCRFLDRSSAAATHKLPCAARDYIFIFQFLQDNKAQSICWCLRISDSSQNSAKLGAGSSSPSCRRLRGRETLHGARGSARSATCYCSQAPQGQEDAKLALQGRQCREPGRQWQQQRVRSAAHVLKAALNTGGSFCSSLLSWPKNTHLR